MPWIIGIDEAGYGPNLGPFVMTSVAVRLPNDTGHTDLWRVLASSVRRYSDPADERIVVADSKLVYSPVRGLADLETAVLATLRSVHETPPVQLADYIGLIAPGAYSELGSEPWFQGTTGLPVSGCDHAGAAGRFTNACREKQVSFVFVRSVVVCPARFNALIERWGSKGAVLGLSLVELLHANNEAIDDQEPIAIFIDKHGGRNNYAPMLQHAFTDDLVLAYEETRERSVYRVARAAQPVTITIQPRADSAHFCVALASQYSKYLRELLMLEFNRFWQQHVPDLKPTAGYPTDAHRFLIAIRPLLARLLIAEATVWRQR